MPSTGLSTLAPSSPSWSFRPWNSVTGTVGRLPSRASSWELPLSSSGWAAKIPQNASGQEQRAAWLLESPFHHSVPRRLENAEQRCGTSAVEDTRHILKILSIFAFIIPFWSIFEQTASSWVSQGSRMIPLSIPLPGGSWSIGPAQIQAANPIFVMVFIPLITVFVYPRVATLARPLVRLGTGLALSSATFLIVAFLQYRLEEGTSMSIAWQLIPYCVLTISEILVSTTGLEFAYTQAPAHLKSLITSFWNLTILQETCWWPQLLFPVQRRISQRHFHGPLHPVRRARRRGGGRLLLPGAQVRKTE